MSCRLDDMRGNVKRSQNIENIVKIWYYYFIEYAKDI